MLLHNRQMITFRCKTRIVISKRTYYVLSGICYVYCKMNRNSYQKREEQTSTDNEKKTINIHSELEQTLNRYENSLMDCDMCTWEKKKRFFAKLVLVYSSKIFISINTIPFNARKNMRMKWKRANIMQSVYSINAYHGSPFIRSLRKLDIHKTKRV